MKNRTYSVIDGRDPVFVGSATEYPLYTTAAAPISETVVKYEPVTLDLSPIIQTLN